MYLSRSILEGLRILGFDKETIKKVSKERSLEEIFLSTLFLNYLIILVVFSISLITGGIYFQGKQLNNQVFFGLLMIYPFTYNLVIYGIYGFFGLISEMLNSKNKIKPLISVGFHTAITYSIVFYVIALLSLINLSYGLFLFLLFLLWFIFTMFVSISVLYKYSLPQTLIIIFVPFLIFGTILLILIMTFPEFIKYVLSLLFV